MQDDYLLSINQQNEVFLHPLIGKWNSTFKLGHLKDQTPLTTLSGFDFIHPYIYREELYFIYGNVDKEFSILQRASDKMIQKRFYNYGKKFKDGPNPLIEVPSFVQVGSNIWLYVKILSILVHYFCQNFVLKGVGRNTEENVKDTTCKRCLISTYFKMKGFKTDLSSQ